MISLCPCLTVFLFIISLIGSLEGKFLSISRRSCLPMSVFTSLLKFGLKKKSGLFFFLFLLFDCCPWYECSLVFAVSERFFISGLLFLHPYSHTATPWLLVTFLFHKNSVIRTGSLNFEDFHIKAQLSSFFLKSMSFFFHLSSLFLLFYVSIQASLFLMFFTLRVI